MGAGPAGDAESFRALLDEADIALLTMSLVQLTGEFSWLDKIAPYIHGPWDFANEVPPAVASAIRDALARELTAGRAGHDPAGLRPGQLRQMMSVCVGEQVPEEYVGLVSAETGLAQSDILNVTQLGNLGAAVPDGFHVVVIGAGISGICAAIGLRQLGIPFTVVEKNSGLGGTWYENAYPGAGVDTPNHFYSFSFDSAYPWTRYYALRDELLAYLEQCADTFGIRPAIRFGTEVLGAEWLDSDQEWRLTLSGPGETGRPLRANVVISAVGQLNRPLAPAVPGLSDFGGPVVHTARWPQDLDLAGKRVAMIGAGASAMQAGPSLAPLVDELMIFQRSPHWVAHNPNYHREVSAGTQWAIEHVPHYAAWFRFQLFWGSSDGVHATLRRDPDWPSPDRAMNARNDETRAALERYLRAQLAGRPDLIRQSLPGFPPYGKRMLRDNYWFEMLRRPNVTLVTEPLREVAGDALITRAGRRYEADVILLATGFDARRMLAPMAITGRGGASLRTVWGDEDPQAYLGIAVPEFPNFFVLFGPNTVLAHGGSTIFHTECQVRHTLLVIERMLRDGYSSAECRPEPYEDYSRAVDDAIADMVWSHPSVSNWYKNSRGKVVMTSPWRLVDYWRMTAVLNPDHYAWRRADRQPGPAEGA